MNNYFEKIQLEIFYPDFHNDYDKTIASIHYQLAYPDLQGNQVFRVKCFMNPGKENSVKNLEPAIWTPSSGYTQMIFNFLKADKPNVNIIIRRTIYFKPEVLVTGDNPRLSEISIHLHSNDGNDFEVNKRTEKIDVQNKITIGIGEIGGEMPESSIFYKTEF